MTKLKTVEIYRGYDIKHDENAGCYRVAVGDRLCDGAGGAFRDVDHAITAIDTRRRSRVAAGLSAVGD